ncbi:anti-sigma regulatory factor (Ser/Thr protein kinase) [Streptomyces aurantiacus]|uniref:ATP-binding protein n=1 Tax=Streptomyces aurantiacus TaxID=47760 RepID=UPI0027943EF3|nr:ATP-binding protein [Streptomyces aurantiacus]MDQ0774711.1 anti-sigma regulatory factor (Ser/Thr protein kinase) [Streptomyces aurantiacus]
MIEETSTPQSRVGRPVGQFTVQLSSTPRGARLARLLATEQLRARGFPLDPARQIVAELAGNAATHGHVTGRDFQMALHLAAHTLRIEMTDTRGDCLPHRQEAACDAESGRGLVLVEVLADRWGVTEGPRPRKTVWAELDSAPALAPSPAPESDRAGFGGEGALPKEPLGGKDPTKPHPTSLPNLPLVSASPHSRE